MRAPPPPPVNHREDSTTRVGNLPVDARATEDHVPSASLVLDEDHSDEDSPPDSPRSPRMGDIFPQEKFPDFNTNRVDSKILHAQLSAAQQAEPPAGPAGDEPSVREEDAGVLVDAGAGLPGLGSGGVGGFLRIAKLKRNATQAAVHLKRMAE